MSAHFIGMFAFAAPIGLAADRYGRRAVILVGAVVCATGAITTPLTVGSVLVAPCFLLLGLGWCGSFVAGTTILADVARADERGRLVTIAGSVPIGGMSTSLLVSAGNPTLWFARILRRRLIASGIDVTGPAADGDDISIPSADTAAILYTYRSHPLSDIVQPLLKNSINLYGEAVHRLNAAGPLPHTNDQALDGIKQRMLSWGISTDGFQIVDGSGLSRRDVLSPEALLTVLMRMYDPAGVSPWMRALPVAGVDGTLSARMKGTPGENNVRAKTGTMSNVRSLAGYVTTRDGEPLAFTCIINNFEGTGAQANAALDAVAVRLASFSR